MNKLNPVLFGVLLLLAVLGGVVDAAEKAEKLIAGAARSVAALLGNSTHFSTGSATGPLAAAVRGSDIKVIAASYNKFPYAFVVRPDIRTPKDLRGKKINI